MTQIASFSADGGGRRIKDLEEGDNIIRLIPGFGKHAATGKFRQYFRLEYGYRNSEDRLKPFQGATEKDFNGNMTVEGAAYRRRMQLEQINTQLKNQIDSLGGEANAGAELLEKKKNVGGLLRKFNSRGLHVLNVLNLKGEIFCQKLPQTAWKALKERIEEVKAKYGFDPILIKGCFFVITKTKAGPNGRDTTYTASIYTEPVPGGQPGQMQLRMHELTQDIINRLEGEAWDLETVWPTVTAEEEERIVQGGPTAVDAILGQARQNINPPAQAETPAQTPAHTAPTETPAPTPTYDVNTPPAQETPAQVPQQNEAELLNSIGHNPEQAAVPPAGTTVQTPAQVPAQETPAVPNTQVATQSDPPADGGISKSEEEFLKGLGV